MSGASHRLAKKLKNGWAPSGPPTPAERHMSSTSGEGGIGVYARIRPDDNAEPPPKPTNAKGRWGLAKKAAAMEAAKDGVTVRRNGEGDLKQLLIRNLEFTLDWVFDGHASQEDVYTIVARERVTRVLKGYNVCILAYGQTGSGKTHTM